MKNKKTSEEIMRDMESGDKEEDIYSEEGREELLEEDEISSLDEGEKTAICNECKKVLKNKIVEGEFDEQFYRFCSEKCATIFEEKFHENK